MNFKQILDLFRNTEKLEKKRLTQKYLDSAKAEFKKEGDTICLKRANRCAKHLLSSIIFRENSQATNEKTGSILLPAIGFYYSLYHLGVALLWLDYSLKETDLAMMHHSQLKNLLKSKLIDRKILNIHFLNVLEWLQEIREETNYAQRIFLYDEEGYNYHKELYIDNELYRITGIVFEEAIYVVKKIIENSDKIFEFEMNIKTYIGDSKGDDMLITYLSDEDKKRVWKYLIEYDLTN